MIKIEKNDAVWDQELIEKYNYSGPRYTSYPTALEFNEDYTHNDFMTAVNRYPSRPLSLYVHIPFCHKLCYFCGCNKIVTQNSQKVIDYLDKLRVEIINRSALFKNRVITQMHWGGGTPTYLSADEISQLMAMLKTYFNFADNAEISIEIDPREIDLSIIDHLAQEGFNRISVGIQDFNKETQKIINREQDENFIRELTLRAKQCNITSINFDLIYGLPKQTPQGFRTTLEKIVELDPDRLSIFNYAHLPSRFAAQRKIKDQDLLSPKEKLILLQGITSFLLSKGYHYIGMDHFSKPTDELSIAQQQGLLHRNFQGYTTQGSTDLLGLGVSAISMLGDTYAQNQKDLKLYHKNIDETGHALYKGLVMTTDDCIRRDVIKTLICNFKLDCQVIEKKYHIVFNRYFEEDLKLMTPFLDDELVNIEKNQIIVTPKGRFLIRNICICFDLYFRNIARQQQFSRVI